MNWWLSLPAPEALNYALLWAIRLSIPFAVWRLRWRWFCLSCYLLLVAIASFVQPGFAGQGYVAVCDVALALLGLCVTGSLVARLVRDSERPGVVYVWLIAAGAVAGLAVAGWHGLATGWDLMESLRLVTHTGYSVATGLAIIYVAVSMWRAFRAFSGESELFYRAWKNAWLWFGWMGLHTAVSLAPERNDSAWYANQIAYRTLLVAILWGFR